MASARRLSCLVLGHFWARELLGAQLGRLVPELRLCAQRSPRTRTAAQHRSHCRRGARCSRAHPGALGTRTRRAAIRRPTLPRVVRARPARRLRGARRAARRLAQRGLLGRCHGRPRLLLARAAAGSVRPRDCALARRVERACAVRRVAHSGSLHAALQRTRSLPGRGRVHQPWARAVRGQLGPTELRAVSRQRAALGQRRCSALRRVPRAPCAGLGQEPALRTRAGQRRRLGRTASVGVPGRGPAHDRER